MLPILLAVLFPMFMAFAAISDLFTMTISNRVTLSLALLFLPLAVAAGLDPHQILLHFACGLGVLVLTFGMFAMGWIGGGDAKLAAATALWIGFSHVTDYGLNAAIIGGALTLSILYMRTLPLPAWALGKSWMCRLHDQNTGIPYGIALAIGGLMIYPESNIWSAVGAA